MKSLTQLAQLGAFGISLLAGLSAGAAMAGTITTTSVSLPNGTVGVNIYDPYQYVDGGGNNVAAGTIRLQTTTQGVLDTYCVDLFDYINTGSHSYTFNNNALAAGQNFSNGTATGTWTQNQVNLITALLTNGSLQTQNTINSAALQVAIWEVEYDTAATNGSYNLTAHDGFHFYSTGDSNSTAVLSQAQSFLNDATGYQSGSGWVGATWLTDSTHYVNYLTSSPSGTQNLVYLAAGSSPTTGQVPEPSTVALFGLGLIGLWAVRRRKLI